MANVLILGAGMNGLEAAILLARDGHRVTVLERDPAPPAGSADELWAHWERRGVNQFHHPHFMHARWTATVQQELPDLVPELERLGARRLAVADLVPAAWLGELREGDERLGTLTARRPVIEGALAAVASGVPGLTVRHGVTVTGLLTEGAPPRVVGVLVAGGQTFTADLVVDATGRRSAVTGMLTAAGARHPHEERDSAGFVYYARHYRSTGALPQPRATVLQHFSSLSALTLPCDNDTWAVAFVTSSRDRELRALRDVAVWERLLRRYPTVAPWGEGEPITDVQVIAGIEDRYRSLVVDGEPVATGLVLLGDSWACTNPSLGRGSTIGLLHACALRDTLREVPADDARALALRFDEVTRTTVEPWYRATRAFDTHRLAEIDGDISGRPYLTPDSGWGLARALHGAAPQHPDLVRAQSAVAGLVATPPEALAAPGLLERVVALGANAPRYPASAPDRQEVLAVLAGGSSAGGDGAQPQIPPQVPAPRPAADPPSGLFVQDTGDGVPVLLVHGWPDTHRMWRHQVPALTAAGHRVLAPDLRGFGDSPKPPGVEHYELLKMVADLLGVLDRAGVPRAHVVGHDWGGALGSVLTALAPHRVASLTCLAVGHPAAFAAAGWAQRERSWYMLLFQFPGIAEQWLSQRDFANLRAWTRHPDADEVVARLRDPEALTASLGLYRAVLPPQTLLAPPSPLPPIQVPTLGVWASDDLAVTEQALTGMRRFVVAPWRYERLDGVGHWMTLDAPERVNALLLDFLGSVQAPAGQAVPAGG